MNSTSKGPISHRSPSATVTSSVCFRRPASSIRPLGQPEGQLGAEYRETSVAQQVRQRTDVILVAMGGYATNDVVGTLEQPGEVGKDQVDTEHVGVGEHQATVDQEQRALEFEYGTVATDITEPSEERDVNRGFTHERPSRTTLAASSRPARRGPHRGSTLPHLQTEDL